MLWVGVFAAIAVGGLVMLVGYAVWLAHKAADVLSELAVLADQGAQLAELLGQIQVPAGPVVPDPHSDVTVLAQGDVRNPA